MQHQGWWAGRPAALSAFICGTKTAIVSTASVCKPGKGRRAGSGIPSGRRTHCVSRGGCAVRAADRASTGAWCPGHEALGHARWAGPRGPRWTGPGLSHKDQGPVRRLSQQAVSVAVTGHPGPSPEQERGVHASHTLATTVRGHYHEPWLHGQPSPGFRCRQSLPDGGGGKVPEKPEAGDHQAPSYSKTLRSLRRL